MAASIFGILGELSTSSLIIVLLVITLMIVILVIFTLSERHLIEELKRDKGKEKVKSEDRIDALKKSKAPPERIFALIDKYARDLFSKRYKLNKDMDYSDIVDFFSKRKDKVVENFSRHMMEGIYSGKKIDEKNIKPLLSEFEYIANRESLRVNRSRTVATNVVSNKKVEVSWGKWVMISMMVAVVLSTLATLVYNKDLLLSPSTNPAPIPVQDLEASITPNTENISYSPITTQETTVSEGKNILNIVLLWGISITIFLGVLYACVVYVLPMIHRKNEASENPQSSEVNDIPELPKSSGNMNTFELLIGDIESAIKNRNTIDAKVLYLELKKVYSTLETSEQNSVKERAIKVYNEILRMTHPIG